MLAKYCAVIDEVTYIAASFSLMIKSIRVFLFFVLQLL